LNPDDSFGDWIFFAKGPQFDLSPTWAPAPTFSIATPTTNSAQTNAGPRIFWLSFGLALESDGEMMVDDFTITEN
jgi:hypothetical protein